MSEANLTGGRGGGGVPIRSIAWFPHGTDPDITINGDRFLRNGLLETDPTKFDARIWGDTPGLHWPRLVHQSYGNGARITDMESTPSGDIMIALASAVTAVGATLFRSVDGGLSWGVSTPGNLDMVALGFNGLAFGAGKFVAVGDAGKIATSTDGTVWTLRTSNAAAGLMGISWNGSMFVAVGHGVIFTSADGITWTARAVPTGVAGRVIMAAVFGNNKWVVAAQGGEVASAPADGSVWATGTSGISGGYLYFDEDISKFILSGGGKVAMSSDGIVWEVVVTAGGPTLPIAGGTKMFKMGGYYYWVDVKGLTLVRSKNFKSVSLIFPVPQYASGGIGPYDYITAHPGGGGSQFYWAKKLANGKIYFYEFQGGGITLYQGNLSMFAGSPIITAQTLKENVALYQAQLQPYTRIS